MIKELLAKVKGSAVYWHAEVTPGEAAVEGGVKSVVESEGARWHAFWANTLYHIDDLPFRLEDMPTNYSKTPSTLFLSLCGVPGIVCL